MPGLIPVAVQMVTSKASNGKQPVVISVKASDNAKLKTVKSLINNMVVIDADKRISAQEVVDALKSIVGMLATDPKRTPYYIPIRELALHKLRVIITYLVQRCGHE